MVVFRWVALASLCATAAVSAVSCAATGTGNTGGTGTTSASGGGGGSATTSSATGGATTTTTGAGAGGETFYDSGTADAQGDVDVACGLITQEAKSFPLDLYIAFDKSTSMGSGAGSKWESARGGLTAFFNDPASAGVSVALNFFPLDGTPATCDQHLYEAPLVAYGALPGNAAALLAAFPATPNGFSTPIYPALGGAILAAKAHANGNPGHAAAVLLVTDGAPQGPTSCGGLNPEDPANIAALATAGAAPGFDVKTFVIGLPGVSQSIANQIAVAGGTDAAIVVGTTDVQGSFQKALAQVRGKALPCTFELPTEVTGGQIDYGHVNVLRSSNGGPSSVLLQNPTCNGPGWKYDDAANPTQIELCPQSCTDIKADLGAKVQIQLGCATQVVN